MSDSAPRISLDDLLAERGWVRRLAARLAPDASAADDLEQETWLAAMRNPPRAGSPRAWLGTVMRNLAHTAHRRSSRRSSHETAAARRGEAGAADDVVAEAELHARLIRAVLDLDEPYRSAVLLRFFHGLDVSEIAARTGTPVETVKTRVKRAIARLRERMGDELGGDERAWALLVLGAPAADVGRLAPVTAAGAGAAAAVGGGLAMAAATKAVVAAAVVVLAGAAWWLVPKGDEDGARSKDAAPETAPQDTTAAAPAKHAPRTRAAAPDESATTAAAPTPAAPAQVPLGPDVVHGRVIDDDTGAPVAKATVSLVWEHARSPGKEPSAVTADDGTFRIPGAEDGRFGELLLRADGYAECLVELPWRSQTAKLEKHDAGDVRIFRGRAIAGVVVAADGVSPVEGASIRLSTTGGSSSLMWITYARECGTTDGRGEFALERVPPSHAFPYTLFAFAKDGLGWTTLAADAGRVDTKGVHVSLRPNAGATVTVHDEAGAPVQGVEVVASPRFEPLGPRPEWDVGHDVGVSDAATTRLFLATTDAQGVARFATLPAVEPRAAYEFVAAVTATGARSWKAASLRAGETATVDLVVARPRIRTVTGVVRDAEKKPVAGATVRVGQFYDAPPAKTGADGRFSFQGYDASWGDQDWIEVKAPGFAVCERSIKADVKSDVLTVDIDLKPAGPIAGRVVDQDGKPVAGEELATDRDDASINGRRVTTDADGRFEFKDTSAGEWRLQMHPPAPQDEWEFMPPVTFRGGDRNAMIVQRRCAPGKARLVVAVVDEAGAPLAPDQVRLTEGEEGSSLAYAKHGKVDIGSGRVVVERMKPGRWNLWLHFPERLGTVVGVDVPDAQADVAVRIVVGKPGVLRGRVDVGDSGAPMPHMVMPELADGTELMPWAVPHGPRSVRAARVEADGTFEFPDVMPGRWRALVREGGFVGEAVADVPAGGEGVCVVKLTKSAKVSFRLAADPPAATVECWFGREGEPMRRWISGRAGPGKQPALECALVPGRWRWRVSFSAPNSYAMRNPVADMQEGVVDAAPGETAVVEVAVVPKPGR